MKDMGTPPPPQRVSLSSHFFFCFRSGERGEVSWVLSTRNPPPPISFELGKWVTGVGQTYRPADEFALTVEVTILVTTPSFCLDIGDVLLRTDIVVHVVPADAIFLVSRQ